MKAMTGLAAGVTRGWTTEDPADSRGCKGAQAVPWARKDDYALLRCPTSASVRAVALRSGQQGTADYASYCDHASFSPSRAANLALSAVVAQGETYRQTGRWLDFGYGEGVLLMAAERAGWRCSGVEAAAAALEFGRRRGWDVHDPAAAPLRLPESCVDVVTLVEVVEHLGEPEQVLLACAKWLRPGGFLYLSTPNPRSLNARVLGARWSVFCPPEHVTFWSAEGLRAMLIRAGLRPVLIRSSGLNPVEILHAFRRSAIPTNRQRAAESLNEMLSSSEGRLRMKDLANAVLAQFGWGDTLKAWCEKPS